MSKPMSEQMQKLAARYEKATGKKFGARTNADRIRAMSDAELCKLLMAIPDVPCDLDENIEKCNFKCEECITEWLQQPAEEETT